MMMKVFVPALLLLTLAACGGANACCRARAERAGGRNLDVTRDIRGGSISGGRDDTREFVEST